MNPPSADAFRLTTHQQVAVVTLSVLLLLFVLHLVRRRAIREEYSILWLSAGILLVIATLFYDVTLFVTRLLGAVAPATGVFLVAIFFLVVLNIQITVVISRQTAKINRLVRELAFFDERIERLEQPKGSRSRSHCARISVRSGTVLSN